MSVLSSNSQIIEPQKTSTLEEFIEAGNTDERTYNNFSLLFHCNSDPNVVLASTNIIYDYMDEIKKCVVEVELTDKQYLKYRYKPKLFAYDVYGSTELFFVIMAINGICDIKDFNKKKIKALYVSDMDALLNNIYNAESSYIKKNRVAFNNNEI